MGLRRSPGYCRLNSIRSCWWQARLCNYHVQAIREREREISRHTDRRVVWPMANLQFDNIALTVDYSHVYQASVGGTSTTPGRHGF